MTSISRFSFTNNELNQRFNDFFYQFTCEDFGLTNEILEKCEIIDMIYTGGFVRVSNNLYEEYKRYIDEKLNGFESITNKYENLELNNNNGIDDITLLNNVKNNPDKLNDFMELLSTYQFNSIHDFQDKYARCRLYNCYRFNPNETIQKFIDIDNFKRRRFYGELPIISNNLLQFQLDMHIDELFCCGW